MKELREGLTYNDVLLVPKRTPLSSRSEGDFKTRFTTNVYLNNPLVSANMATVTEHKMAIAMAREGGLGIIHQFCPIEEEVDYVRRVKKSTSYIIEEPVTTLENITIKEAVNLMNEKEVTSLLVTKDDELVGIFTSRDYLFEDNLDKKISDVMTSKERLVTAEYGISIADAKKILHQYRIEKLPLLKDGKLAGLMTTQDIVKLDYWPNACRDEKGRLKVGAAVGVKDTIKRADALIKAGVDVLVLDIAHCHSDYAIARLKELKQNFPNIDVMAGNIATGAAAYDLIEAGADGLKVGIGPSPVCTTRIVSGSGVPQFTAVVDVCEVAKKYNIPVCADGGLKEPGDIVKALAAGASSIFSGSLFAGTDEAPGLIISKDGKKYKKYSGSASYESNHDRKERLEGKKIKERLDARIEGIATLVDYKGPVEAVIKYLINGVQSGVSYNGARNISELQKNPEFIKITSNGRKESETSGNKLSE